jgi:hypothetical protein
MNRRRAKALFGIPVGLQRLCQWRCVRGSQGRKSGNPVVSDCSSRDNRRRIKY